VIRGLDHLAIKVSDPDRASAFYARVLGAQVERLPFGRLRFRIGDAALHVHTRDSTPHPLPRYVPPPGSSDLCLVWDGTAEEAVEHLAGCGLPVVEGPVERDGRDGTGRSVYFNDPDGNLLELISYAAGGGPPSP
jgi:catechol 2,3-dioxygenase-like lactoylglutathione lyase family enzyme